MKPTRLIYAYKIQQAYKYITNPSPGLPLGVLQTSKKKLGRGRGVCNHE
jgi:hypothetical protein